MIGKKSRYNIIWMQIRLRKVSELQMNWSGQNLIPIHRSDMMDPKLWIIKVINFQVVRIYNKSIKIVIETVRLIMMNLCIGFEDNLCHKLKIDNLYFYKIKICFKHRVRIFPTSISHSLSQKVLHKIFISIRIIKEILKKCLF